MHNTGRRQFLKTTARYLALTALGATAGRQIIKNLYSPCPAHSLCSQCEKNHLCTKPPAADYRKEQTPHVR
jgi:hypothetical protein